MGGSVCHVDPRQRVQTHTLREPTIETGLAYPLSSSRLFSFFRLPNVHPPVIAHQSLQVVRTNSVAIRRGRLLSYRPPWC